MKILFAPLFCFLLIAIFNACKKQDTVKPYIQPPVKTSGPSTVYFWTADTMMVPIYVSLDNQVGRLDESYAGIGSPKCCNYCGSLKFNLNSGTYDYKTWRAGRDTIRGIVTVKYDTCNWQQIDY
jgi:hypothetical protein